MNVWPFNVRLWPFNFSLAAQCPRRAAHCSRIAARHAHMAVLSSVQVRPCNPRTGSTRRQSVCINHNTSHHITSHHITLQYIHTCIHTYIHICIRVVHHPWCWLDSPSREKKTLALLKYSFCSYWIPLQPPLQCWVASLLAPKQKRAFFSQRQPVPPHKGATLNSGVQGGHIFPSVAG